MKNRGSKHTLTIGLMLFALFLGAGNMIFPTALGQAAGSNVIGATIGFLITGVGLPLLGVTAIAISGGNLRSIANRVHPIFGIIFTIILYLAIGPFFGIPRTGTVAFEIGVTPFLPKSVDSNGFSLFIYTIIFFAITYWLSLNPTKLVDRIGKILTPLLIIVLALLVGRVFISPMGDISKPQAAYQSSPFFKGFIEGYLTLDALAALVFGIVVINAIKDKGINNQREITITTIKAGAFAAIGLMLVYVSLAYLGATSIDVIGPVLNGGQILSEAATYYYKSIGTVILGIAITFACLTTSIGLVSACSEFFNNIFPTFTYSTYVGIFSTFSMLVANVGLTQLIAISVPILMIIYPIAISLMFLTFLDKFFNGEQFVYIGGVVGAAVISILEGFKAAGILSTNLNELLNTALPFYSVGVGWLIPFIIGSIIGYFIKYIFEKSNLKDYTKA
ncbi:branched-chain amino acid transport system II carrier protein [Bacillus sp. Marseille-P3661]|uniref:branched-chain amino acid transport system II carrier protein n=1 Tax=Bacillus sp. Marseille-P3661 TaxID=1936234 RepID=UPI000C81BB1B|nr:branched-chain amino acid transport system II carrier protein [Bacillus sp. Marseille-P3661]